MEFDKQKEQLREKVKFIIGNFTNITNPTIIKRLSELETDIENDFFSIVILGEFKRGKSTFVNSLIGEKLLPADVLPTTATINALMWDEDRITHVIKSNGEIEEGASSLKYLRKFVADESINFDNIKYIKIGYPAEILKNDVVIVDTPGVSDINEQRVQVTYDFIPKANSIIFLLDATSPLKRSEKEFIDDHLIKLGIDRILFIANKFDEVDEEEEETVLEDLRNRLISAFKKNDKTLSIKDITVLPLSSLWALKGIEDKNELLIEQSGINAVKNKIDKIISDGSVAEEKIKCYKLRLSEILNVIQRDTDNQISLYQTNIDDLKRVMLNIDKMLNEKEQRKTAIHEYIENEQESILAMTKKSMTFFHSKLKEEIDESIDRYKGSDFKDYIEKTIVTVVRKNMERWISTYYLYIEQLLDQLELEVARGLTRYFKKQVSLGNCSSSVSIADNQARYIMNFEVEDVSVATTQAGLLSAGAAGVMMLVGGSILIPIISMAAFPLLQKKFLERKIEEVKINVKPEVNQQLLKCMYNLSAEVIGNINIKIETVKQASETIYDQLFKSIKKQIQEEISRKENTKDDLDKRVSELKELLRTIESMKQGL